MLRFLLIIIIFFSYYSVSVSSLSWFFCLGFINIAKMECLTILGDDGHDFNLLRTRTNLPSEEEKKPPTFTTAEDEDTVFYHKIIIYPHMSLIFVEFQVSTVCCTCVFLSLCFLFDVFLRCKGSVMISIFHKRIFNNFTLSKLVFVRYCNRIHWTFFIWFRRFVQQKFSPQIPRALTQSVFNSFFFGSKNSNFSI